MGNLNNNDGNTDQNSGQEQQGISIDYDKIQSMIDKGTQQKENAILKSYFQQQGLTEEEAKHAMSAYREKKKESTPDIGALQAQIQSYQEQARQSAIEKEAMLVGVSLGLEAKQIPYITKMADFSKAFNDAGVVNQEAIKEAMNKVLEDFPQLKPSTESKGFQQIGANGGNGNTEATNDLLNKAFGL